MARILVMFGVMLTGVASAQMSTPGGFRVSETGAAVYEIPIKVPPGVAGMEPKLSLVYSSQSGNGLLGVGWSLQGLSSITRCPRTMAQDGVRGGVNYDTNDRYCLDGQRLMAISGTYGADGTEYRTERESFTKVISYGTAGNGPSYFKAWTKSGQIIEFGNTADSKVEAQGKSTVRVWAMNKVQDAKGNYLTATYTEDNPNGDYYPSRIDFTGNVSLGLPSLNFVQFNYETRSDSIAKYLGGSLYKSMARLKNIWTHVNTALVQNYTLSYEYGATISRTRLTGVTESSSSGYFPWQSFIWQESSSGFSLPANWIQHGGSFVAGQAQYVDVNGDGLTDLVLQSNDNRFLVSLSSGSGFGASVQWLQHGGSFVAGGASYADVDGDGRADLIFQGLDNRFWVSRSTGGGFTTPVVWVQHGGSFVEGQANYADVDGDGRADLIFQSLDNRFWVSLSTGTGFTGPAQWMQHGGSFGVGQQAHFADVNGDGIADLIWQGNDNIFSVSLSSGSGFGAPIAWMQHGGSYQPGQAQYADVNGDGLMDLIFQSNDNRFLVSLSSGSGFGTPVQWMQHGGTFAAGHARYTDVNGDGKVDLIWQGDDNAFSVSLSSGSGFAAAALWVQHGGSFQAGHAQYADVSGDGKADLVMQGSDNAFWVSTSNGAFPDLLLTAASGLGASATTVFKRLTDAMVYAKDTAGTYPTLNLQAPFYVVSSSSSSNGIGGTVSTNYYYTGLKAELGTGRGLLGFKQVDATDASTGVKSQTQYRQDWPYVGMPSQSKRIAPDGTTILSQTDYTYTCTNPASGSACTVAAGNRYFPYASQSDETSRDLNNTFMSKVRTTSTYDALGNATVIGVTHLDAGGSSLGYSKTTTNTYTNDTTNWLLGRLIRSEVQSVAP